MILRNRAKIGKPYSGSTKFEFWKNLQREDVILTEMNVKPPGQNSGRLYATNLKFTNERTNETFKCSLTEASKYLSKIDYQEL